MKTDVRLTKVPPGMYFVMMGTDTGYIAPYWYQVPGICYCWKLSKNVLRFFHDAGRLQEGG